MNEGMGETCQLSLICISWGTHANTLSALYLLIGRKQNIVRSCVILILGHLHLNILRHRFILKAILESSDARNPFLNLLQFVLDTYPIDSR
jgi:hypothetical protein